MSKQRFLDMPKEECSSMLSIGERGGGKTYVMLNSVKYWLDNNIFDELHLVIPSFEDEQHDSYKWLIPYLDQNVYVYESYNTAISERLIKMSKENTEKNKKNPNKEPLKKWLLVIDDSSHMEKNLFRDTQISLIAVKARHLRVHTWIIMHYDKGIIPKKVKEMIDFVFIYNVSKELLSEIYKTFVNFPQSFDNFKEFANYFYGFIMKQEYGSFLVIKKNRMKGFDSYVSTWFGGKNKLV